MSAGAAETDPVLVGQYRDHFAGHSIEPEVEPTLAVIDAAMAQLQSSGAPSSALQRGQLRRARFHLESRGDRFAALHDYREAASDPYPAGTEAAAEAKIAMAELVPAGIFTSSVRLCGEVLQEHPGLASPLRDRCLRMLGLAKYQLEDEAGAVSTFEALLSGEPDAATVRTARLHLDGIADPDSTSAIFILSERSELRILTECAADEAFWDSQRIIARSVKPFFAQYLADQSIDPEERAELLYRVSFARFSCGYGADALQLARQALSQIEPGHGVARAKCRYMIAFMLGRMQKWPEAEVEWRGLIDSDPPLADYMPQAYLEWSRARHLSGDPLGAVFTLEELMVRFPQRKEVDAAIARVRGILLRTPDIRADYYAGKETVIARAEERWKQPQRMMAVSPPKPDPTPVPQLASTGGAE